ncbi:PREDICTED: unnamed product [Prunus dulcis]|uniref:PREDICTED: unnamed product n=1 Tax=Prunus dulcis TaxID=3755 RepID=A0A5E4G091_PRUDU|nr:uncharacterized protein LOC117629231 isoform X1 [Prunus dulcis]XP_034217648.1 uncharacterized protein LOC117629231 isoform X1 [Prunus dulcis]VVA33157.1 PREDICTED: unnamed product [Prunus dulcis]
MKISLRFQEDQPEFQNQQNPLIKAKVPLTIFNQPFISSIATVPSTTTSTSMPTNSSSHLSFSLSSNFSSGPSVKLSYSHTSTTPSPFSLSLKSGLGLFGSPKNSPLVFTANFSLSHTNPSFSLHIKPQFGNFSLKQTAFSDPNFKQISGSASNVGAHLDSGSVSNGDFDNGFVSEGSSVWQELRLEPCGGKNGAVNSEFRDNCGAHLNGGSLAEKPLAWENGGKDGLFSGIAVMARTVLPVTKSVVVNMRWGVNLPPKFGKAMPYLTLDKIGIERVEEVKAEEEKGTDGSNVGDFELLKGMCFWMRRDLEVMEKENKEMKHRLEEMKSGVSRKHFRGESDSVGKRVSPPLDQTSGGFEQWRNKKKVREENARTEAKKSTDSASDLESELQRAIKAATI